MSGLKDYEELQSDGAQEAVLCAKLRPYLAQYGISKLRAEQIAPIKSAINGEDCFAILPTGGGKSLCFQLPAWEGEGVTLVISPLLALMREQVQELQALGFEGFALHSELNQDEWHEVMRKVESAKTALLYLSPEQFSKAYIQSWVFKLQLKRVVVDEAHCVSEWGQSFRPSYLQIGAILDRYPHIARSAFTATASARVMADIENHLFSKRPIAKFFHGVERKNIALYFQKKTNQRADILQYVNPLENIIIYASTRNRTEIFAKILQEQGYLAHYYHAGMPSALRQSIEREFLAGDWKIIIATNAFGMGVNKPDIDKVIHADMPMNPESYVQEIGRAGRDGRAAKGICLYSEHDYQWRKEQILTQNENPYHRQIQQDKLDWFYHFVGAHSHLSEGKPQSAQGSKPWHALIHYFEERAKEPVLSQEEESEDILLKRWRYLEARRRNLSPQWVMPDEVLARILDIKPQNIDELAGIFGIGEIRLRDYGDEIVQFFQPQSPSTGARRQKIALDGDGALYEELEAIALELKYGENGQEKPLILSQRQIMQIVQVKPQNYHAFLRVLGNKEKVAKRFSKRMLLAIHENAG